MRTIRQHLTYSKIAFTTCVFLLAGGVAWAATGSSAGTIHACYAKHGGILRIANRCKRGERALSWNEVGRVGAAGVSGAPGHEGVAGLTGLAGAPGPSDIYAAGTVSGELTGSYKSLGEVTLPPGSYLLEGKANFFPKKGVPSEMFCELASDTGGLTYWDASWAKPLGFSATAVLSAVQTFSGAQTVDIICKLAEGEGSFDDAKVTAIKTGSLHGSTPRD